MTDFILQEDGVSEFLLEDGSGALLQEKGEVDLPFIASGTLVYSAYFVGATGELDDFNRLDENPLSDDGLWSQSGRDGALRLAGNCVASVGGYQTTIDGITIYESVWANVFPRDVFLQTRIVATPSSQHEAITLRAHVGASEGAIKAFFYTNGTDQTVSVDGPSGHLITGTAFAASIGDTVGLRVSGTTIEITRNGVALNTTSDPLISSGGQVAIGVQLENSSDHGDTWIDDFTVTVPQVNVAIPLIASATVLYALSLPKQLTVPFIASGTQVFLLEIARVDVPFLASHTRVFGIFSLFDPNLTFLGSGNGGELFAVRLAPNGASETATLATSISASDTLLELTGDGGLPSTEPFIVTIDDEQIYAVQIAAGSYRVRRRGSGNTTAAAHTVGADVVWGDSYDMAIRAGVDVASTFDADIDGSGLTTYPGWLFVFDATQAYLAGDRYPMHVTEFVGVFDAGAGVTGTNRCDAAQPNAISSAEAASDDCPAALSNLSRIDSDISVGDVAVVRYTNPEASALDIGPRSVALQSWFGIKRLDAAGSDVTFTDPNGIAVDTKDGEGTFTGSVNGEWHNPLGPAIGPSTGTPTPNDAPYTSVTLLGSDRHFTRTTEKGWPIGVLAVRQGNRRVPFWQSWDWHDFSYVYNGFGPDCTFAQVVINRNGIIFGSVPEVDLPGTQDIDGPDAVWDDGSYYFGVSWYVAIFNTPYLVAGPAIGGTTGSGTDIGYLPVLEGGGGGFGPPVIAVPGLPPVEGGSGGGIEPPTARKQLFQAAHV